MEYYCENSHLVEKQSILTTCSTLIESGLAYSNPTLCLYYDNVYKKNVYVKATLFISQMKHIARHCT